MRINKRTPFLDLYDRCMATGRLPSTGLCRSLEVLQFTKREIELFQLLYPSVSDKIQLQREETSTSYWGSDLVLIEHEWFTHAAYTQIDKKSCDFTSRRQTILLLCAVMNNEY